MTQSPPRAPPCDGGLAGSLLDGAPSSPLKTKQAPTSCGSLFCDASLHSEARQSRGLRTYQVQSLGHNPASRTDREHAFSPQSPLLSLKNQLRRRRVSCWSSPSRDLRVSPPWGPGPSGLRLRSVPPKEEEGDGFAPSTSLTQRRRLATTEEIPSREGLRPRRRQGSPR
jgi:hypothetical protein